MTIATFTILMVTGSLVLLKLAIMALVVVLWARTMFRSGTKFMQSPVMVNLPDMSKTHR
jgi:hypothetical protein